MSTFSSILVELANFNFQPREQSSKYSSSSCCWVKLNEWCLRHTDTRDAIVCPIETDEQLQKNRKAPVNAVSCSPRVHIAPSQVLPAVLESTWLNTLSYSFLFQEVQKTPTSSRNLWELNKGRVLGVNCLRLVLCACSPDVWNVCACIRHKQLETRREFLIQMCSFFNICVYKWSLVCYETCLNKRKRKPWTSVWIWLFILFVHSKAGGEKGKNNSNLTDQMPSARMVPHFVLLFFMQSLFLCLYIKNNTCLGRWEGKNHSGVQENLRCF